MTWPFWRRQPAVVTSRIEPNSKPPTKQPWRLTAEIVARFRARRAPDPMPQAVHGAVTYKLPKPAPGVVPTDAATMATDETIASVYEYAADGFYGEGLGFVGYPYLAELTQRSEYRKMAEIISEEMTRKWIRLEITGSKNKSDRLKEIEADFERFKLRDVFRHAEEVAQGQGMAHIYVDTGYSEDPAELQTELQVKDIKVARDSLKGFRVVEPVWTSPAGYDTTNPLRPDFYKPQAWYVMGKKVHSSRLMTLIPRPMPDLLKPAFNFGGLSLFQMAKPTVDNWLRTRQSVSDLLHSFTVFLLKTNLGAMLGPGGEALDQRMQLFNYIRDNRGLMAVDKDTEDFGNISVPLGGLDHLQAQAQEQQSSVPSIPLVKLFGITPSGLNASSDGEVRVFYDKMEGGQERSFRDHVMKALQIIQLSRYGEIDPEIGFRFEPLWQMDEAAKAAIRKTNADTAAVYIASGVILPEEERTRVAAEDSSPYAGLDLSVTPEPPDPATEEDPTGAGDPAAGAHRASEINGGSGV